MVAFVVIAHGESNSILQEVTDTSLELIAYLPQYMYLDEIPYYMFIVIAIVLVLSSHIKKLED